MGLCSLQISPDELQLWLIDYSGIHFLITSEKFGTFTENISRYADRSPYIKEPIYLLEMALKAFEPSGVL